MQGKLNSQVPVLDSLRAFAAISVCLYHFVCTTTGYIKTEWILSLFSVGKYGVQLFFVISGFVIPWAMFHAKFKFKDFFNFILKRLIRLEPPYIFSIFVALCLLFLRSKFLNQPNEHMDLSSTQVFLHFGYLIPFFEGFEWLNQVYWTLAIEFQYYFLIGLLFIPLTKSSMIYRIGFYFLFVALSFIGTNAFLPYWLPVFLIGILLFLFLSKCISIKEYYMTMFFLISFCFYKYPIASMLYILIPVVLIMFFNQVKITGFNYLGKFTYSIYLFHPLFGASFINVMSHSFTSPLAKFLIISLGFIITLVSAWLTYLLIENPSKKLSASIKYK